MKLLYIGDFIKKNGPSTVDLNYRNYLSKRTEESLFFQSTDYKKLFELIRNLNKYDYVIVSGISCIGAIVSFLSKFIFNKKVYYICHGLLKYESQFSKVKTKRFIFEKIIMNNSKVILTVSNLLKEKLLTLYKINDEKVQVQYNGIEFKDEKKEIKKQKYTLLSVGGGRKQKRIINICKAILLSKYKDEINFIVVGENGEDSGEIKKFHFVQYLGFISKEELNEIYEKTEIFLLLSTFDSFPSAFFEALQFKCNIIASQNVGALELFSEELSKLMVVDGENIELIAKRIDEIFEQSNIDDIYKFLLDNREEFSWRNRTNYLTSELKE